VKVLIIRVYQVENDPTIIQCWFRWMNKTILYEIMIQPWRRLQKFIVLHHNSGNDFEHISPLLFGETMNTEFGEIAIKIWITNTGFIFTTLENSDEFRKTLLKKFGKLYESKTNFWKRHKILTFTKCDQQNSHEIKYKQTSWQIY